MEVSTYAASRNNDSWIAEPRRLASADVLSCTIGGGGYVNLGCCGCAAHGAVPARFGVQSPSSELQSEFTVYLSGFRTRPCAFPPVIIGMAN